MLYAVILGLLQEGRIRSARPTSFAGIFDQGRDAWTWAFPWELVEHEGVRLHIPATRKTYAGGRTGGKSHFARQMQKTTGSRPDTMIWLDEASTFTARQWGLLK